MKPTREKQHSDVDYGAQHTKKADTHIDHESVSVPRVKPASLMRPADVLALQRTVGNQSVYRLFMQQRAVGDKTMGLEHQTDVIGARAATEVVQAVRQKATHNPIDAKAMMRYSQERAFEFPIHHSQNSAVPATVLQRDITVGKDKYKPDAEELVQKILRWVKGQLSSWAGRSGELDKKLQQKMNKAMTDKKIQGEVLEQVKRLLIERYNNKAFEDMDDLCRQAEQDIMLFFLNLQEFEGTPQQLDQFTYNKQTKKPGAGNQKGPFRIYRTMPVANWQQYEKSHDVKDLLYGHGGGLGQALHYFQKSKTGKINDVLVEFSFSESSEKQSVDYEEIGKGAEGNGSKAGKMGGKSEQNDMFGMQHIFSINLKKNNELIAGLEPEVRAVQFAIPQDKQEAGPEDKQEASPKDKQEAGPIISPIEVMTRIGRRAAGALYIMDDDDWELYHKYKQENPHHNYSH